MSGRQTLGLLETAKGTGCAQLDNFDWVMPAGYLVGVLPTPEENNSLSDVEPDVCDVPDVFSVRREMAALESFVLSCKPPGGGGVRYSTSVCPAGGVRYSASVCTASCRNPWTVDLWRLDVDMYSLWMAPWDASGTFRIGSRPEVAIRRGILRCVVQLSRRPVFPAASYLGYFGDLARTCVMDLYTGVSTTPVEMLVDDK